MIPVRTSGTQPKTRIVVAASCFADASSGIRLASLLSSRIEADVEGVFVEEEEQAGLFHNPAARIVTTSGERIPAPSPEELRAALKRDALAFEREIARVALEHARKWSFRTLRGRLLPSIGALLHAHDILLLGHRPLLKMRGPVIRLGATNRPDIAAGLAADLGAPIVDIAIAAPETASGDTRGSDTITVVSVAEALAFISRTNASAIVVDTALGPFRLPNEINDLLDSARCPVVLVGAPASDGG